MSCCAARSRTTSLSLSLSFFFLFFSLWLLLFFLGSTYMFLFTATFVCCRSSSFSLWQAKCLSPPPPPPCSFSLDKAYTFFLSFSQNHKVSDGRRQKEHGTLVDTKSTTLRFLSQRTARIIYCLKMVFMACDSWVVFFFFVVWLSVHLLLLIMDDAYFLHTCKQSHRFSRSRLLLFTRTVSIYRR